MPDGSIDLTASANFNALQNEVARQQRVLEKQEKQIDKLTSAHGKYERTGVAGLARLARNAITVAGTYMSVHRAVSFVTEAIRAQIAEIKKQGEAVMTVEDAWSAFNLATLALSDEQKRRLQEGAVSTLLPLGIKEVNIAQITRAAFSATESADQDIRVDRTLSLMRNLGPVTRRELANEPELAKDILLLEKNVFAKGGVSTDETMKEAINLLVAFMSQSPGVSVGVVGPKFLRAISAEVSSSRAETPEAKRAVAAVAASVMAAFMSTIGESGGPLAALATANLGNTLREKAGRKGQTLLGAIDELREQGFDFDLLKLKGRGITKGQQRDIVDNWGVVVERIGENMEVFSNLNSGQLGRLARRMEGFGDPRRFAVTSAQEMEVDREQRMLAEFAEAGSVRSIIESAIAPKSGALNFMRASLNQMELGIIEATQDLTPERGIEFLRSRPGLLRNLQVNLGDRSGLLRGAVDTRERLRLTTADLLEAPLVEGIDEGERKRTESIRLGIEKLIEQIDVQRAFDAAERAREAKELQQNTTSEYGKLTGELVDIAEGITNGSTAAQRPNAESENR